MYNTSNDSISDIYFLQSWSRIIPLLRFISYIIKQTTKIKNAKNNYIKIILSLYEPIK